MEIFDRTPPIANTAWANNIIVPKAPNETVNLRRIATKLWARKWLILAPMIIGGALAFLAAKAMTPVYTAVAQVLIKPQQTGEPAAIASLMSAIRGGPEAVPTETMVLQSRVLAKRTIERLHLDEDPDFVPPMRQPNAFLARFEPVLQLVDAAEGWANIAIGFLAGATDTAASRNVTTEGPQSERHAGVARPSSIALTSFVSRLRVSAQQHTDVIDVSFTSSRPEIATLVPNTVVQLYLDQQVTGKNDAIRRESERLDKIVLPTLREKLRTSERALAEYRQNLGVTGDANPTLLNHQLAELDYQLATSRTKKASINAQLKEIQGLISSSSPTGSTSDAASPVAASESPILARLRDQQVEVQRQLAALKGSLDNNHPRIQQLTAQLQELKGAIRQESAGVVGRLHAELAGAEAAEATLKRRAAEVGHEFAEANGGNTRWQALLNEADGDLKLYQRYLTLANETRSNLGQAQPDGEFVSPADVPIRPSFPNTRLMAMLGGVTGTGVGLVLIALIDNLRGGLRDRQQVEEDLGVTCLGLIPRVRRSRRLPSSASFTEDKAFEQAIRRLGLKLFNFDEPDTPRVVLVTAALPSEGKSWLAANLAASLTGDGFSAVLVDCDQYRPAVHRIFRGPRAPGLTDYLSSANDLEQILYCDRRTGVNYIPVGVASPRPGITTDRLRLLIALLSKRYKYIILDSAPLLAVSDTLLLPQLAQKTILVVKWNSTPLETASDALTELLGSGADTAIALSMVDMRRAAKYGDPRAVAYKRLTKYYDYKPK
jgi:uncharacterized protein involved in exopolysaccharide biosynthesis/Mrp family chromosome partitioning ATPase